MTNQAKRYLIKQKWDFFFKNKYFIKKYFKRNFKEQNNFYVRQFMIYYPIFWHVNSGFQPTIFFNTYQMQFSWLKKKFLNIKYHQCVDLIKDKNEEIRKKKQKTFKKLTNLRFKNIFNFLFLYNTFFYSIYIDLFYFLKKIKTTKQRLYYYLILSFKKNKLFINLQNSRKRNYLFLSTGFFIKFFEKKKSIKKTKTIKLLMAKYIRKIFIISKLKNSILIIKHNPLFLMEILNLFNTPIAHKFIDPVTGKVIEEAEDNSLWLKFLYFIFLDNKDFSKNKIAKKGRIKRKILRKIVFENKIVD